MPLIKIYSDQSNDVLVIYFQIEYSVNTEYAAIESEQSLRFIQKESNSIFAH